MDIRNKKIVPDLRIFAAVNVSKERGRRIRDELERAGRISVLRTPTGRCYLSFGDAERLAGQL